LRSFLDFCFTCLDPGGVVSFLLFVDARNSSERSLSSHYSAIELGFRVGFSELTFFTLLEFSISSVPDKYHCSMKYLRSSSIRSSFAIFYAYF